jgi:hypothetical protein
MKRANSRTQDPADRSNQPNKRQRTDDADIESNGDRVLRLLNSLAEKVDEENAPDSDEESMEEEPQPYLPVLPDTAQDELACWNFALYGHDNDAPMPQDAFTAKVNVRGSPYKRDSDGLVSPKRGQAGSDSRQRAWHRGVVEGLVTQAGMTLDENSQVKLHYQWVTGSAQYHHWELWYDNTDTNTFVSVASFTGKPIHAKNTVTDFEAENLQHLEIGIDPGSLLPLHIQRLEELDGTDERTSQSSIYEKRAWEGVDPRPT